MNFYKTPFKSDGGDWLKTYGPAQGRSGTKAKTNLKRSSLCLMDAVIKKF